MKIEIEYLERNKVKIKVFEGERAFILYNEWVKRNPHIDIIKEEYYGFNY